MDVQEKTNSQLGLCLDILYADGSQNLYDYDDPDVMAGKKSGCFTYLDAFPDDIDAVERWEDQLYLLRRKPLSNGTYYYGNEIEIYKPLQADERFTPLSEADRPEYPLNARYFEGETEDSLSGLLKKRGASGSAPMTPGQVSIFQTFMFRIPKRADGHCLETAAAEK